jgi:hypothetical protein
MDIAYLSTDEVNRALASQLAEGLGISLYLLSLHDGPPDGAFTGALYDLDYLPRERRQEVLKELLAQRPLHPVAIHSYNLEQEQVDKLRQNGVVVSTRLEPEVFAGLLQEQEQSERRVQSNVDVAVDLGDGLRRPIRQLGLWE